MKKHLMRYHFWIMGIAGFMLHSCHSKYRVWVGEKNEQKIFNLQYGEDKKQKMDVFLPENYTKETPVVLIVHGGGWKMGRKEHMIMIQKYLFQKNIPTVNINYRLVNSKITYKEQLEDIRLAIEKFNSLTEKAQLLPNNYIILGESAGGHLSLLYGYQNPHQIKKIISLSGPTDFYSEKYLNTSYSRYSSPTFQDVVGTKFNRKNLSEEFKKASPINNVSNVPTLLFQGGSDFLVNKTQAFTLDKILEEKNIPHRLIFMKNSGHTPRFFSKNKRENLILPEIFAWIKK